MHDQNFFLQRMVVDNITIPRENFFIDLLKGSKTLHVGCTDHPLFDPTTNLHLKLGNSKQINVLDGYDIDVKGLAVLAAHYKGRYFNDIADITDEYDFVLVPEVIEHVPNVELFIHSITTIKSKRFIFTAPNVEGCAALGYFGKTYPNYTEEVHPDHSAWYSPYVLTNVFKKYTNLTIEKTFVINQRKSVGIIATK